MTPAILFDADGYVLDGPKLMGRQSAGHGFLRAAVRAHAGRPIHGLTPNPAAAETFRQAVARIDPAARPVWIPAQDLPAVAERGLLWRPDVNIAVHARERLRLGPAAYSLCGITHTLSSHAPADVLAELIAAPVMPWDAVVCTSTAARAFVDDLLAAQEDYLAWRFGQRPAAARPQLPVIPLGVHAADFAFGDDARGQARAALQIAAEEVAFLFPGRLTFSGKAHPWQMYAALERAARAGRRRLVLVHAGQFASPPIRDAFVSAVALACPSVRCLFVDGADAEAFARAWRAADVFVSLSDNLQETFGITPVEAMAAGLPVLVSDWNGYRDTVRDGLDGFRIPSWAPAPGVGARMALDYETGANSYDHFLSRTSTTVSVDPRALDARLSALVDNADLRRALGEAGRERVRREFDWAGVYARYEALWRELAEIRAGAAADPALRVAAAPKAAPARRDPFQAFAHYPTRQLGPQTQVRAAPGASRAAFEALTAHPMNSFWRAPPELVERLLAACAGEALSVARLSEQLGQPIGPTIERLARLAKLELVELDPGQEA